MICKVHELSSTLYSCDNLYNPAGTIEFVNQAGLSRDVLEWRLYTIAEY
jgi:hypothetical protein